MLYAIDKDSPDRVDDDLPHSPKDIYREAYNNAWEEYEESQSRRHNANREDISHKMALNAVEKKYKKQNGEWVAK